MKTFKGELVTLLGNKLNVGLKVEDFTVVNNQLEKVNLSNFKQDYLVINSVPSLDTPVCDLQTKTLNEEVIKEDDFLIEVITISNDLPFAQNRWKEEHDLDMAVILSDYNYHDFGMKTGLLMEENKLLARSVFILNKKREVIYLQVADEMSKHLDFDEILNFIKELPGK